MEGAHLSLLGHSVNVKFRVKDEIGYDLPILLLYREMKVGLGISHVPVGVQQRMP